MRIIILGAGSVGRYMAEQLVEFGHTITIVDNDPAAIARVHTDANMVPHLGDGCEVDTLRAAGAETADVVAAVTGDDEDNLVVSLLSKQEFGVPRVVARVNNPNNEWMFNDMWGVDVSVSTPHLLTALVEEAVTEGSLVKLLNFDHGKTNLSEVRLAEGSPAIGRQISQLGLPRASTVVGIIRDGHVMAPSGDFTLNAHDEVLVLTTTDVEADLRTALIGTK